MGSISFQSLILVVSMQFSDVVLVVMAQVPLGSVVQYKVVILYNVHRNPGVSLPSSPPQFIQP
jgi:hypothetical protein